MSGRAYDPRFMFSWPNAKSAVMGPAQLAGVISIVARGAAESKGQPYDEEGDAQMRELVEQQIEEQSLAYFTSGMIYDDGVIDPRDTRSILGICLSVIHTRPGRGRQGRRIRGVPAVNERQRENRRHIRAAPYSCAFSRRWRVIRSVLVPTAARSPAGCSAPAATSASPPSRCSPTPTRTRRSSPRPTGRCACPATPRPTPTCAATSSSTRRKRAGADAIHPGYGFLSENADFARQVMDAGLTWVGPAPETIEAMGSKIRAKELMAKAGVPVLSVDPDAATADDFPLLVKASAGGGGRGMRVVTDPADLAGELATAGAEALSAFGDDTVFVEPYLPTARHIEVQVMADTHGTVWVVGDRDCSIQRRHQKVVEEAPAPAVSEPVRKQLHDAARAACEAVGYVGAGTVEFLVADAHEDSGRVHFLEMNTRLQVEHPVTECVTGLDLVALQIAVAEGRAARGGATGTAAATRSRCASTPRTRPTTGRRRPAPSGRSTGAATGNPGDGLRVDSGVEAGLGRRHPLRRDARQGGRLRRRIATTAVRLLSDVPATFDAARRHHQRRTCCSASSGTRSSWPPASTPRCSTSGSTRGRRPVLDEHALALAAGAAALAHATAAAAQARGCSRTSRRRSATCRPNRAPARTVPAATRSRCPTRPSAAGSR